MDVNLYLGIDGGGSNTRALVCDASGSVLGTGRGGPSNPQEFPAETVVESISAAVDQALGSVEGDAIAAAFIGMAGVVSPEDRAHTEACARQIGALQHATIGIDHDIRIALAGGLAGRPGVALIAGTGSSCYGRDASGRSVQVGGWGDGVDDVGSGGWVGMCALRHCVRQADGRDPETGLLTSVMEFLGIRSMDAFQGQVHGGEGLARHERARFAPTVLKLAESGDVAAVSIIEEGVAGLAELVAVAARRLGLGAAEVVLAGGLTDDAGFRARLISAIEECAAGARVAPVHLAPLGGAALLALETDGVPASPEIVDALAKG